MINKIKESMRDNCVYVIFTLRKRVKNLDKQIAEKDKEINEYKSYVKELEDSKQISTTNYYKRIAKVNTDKYKLILEDNKKLMDENLEYRKMYGGLNEKKY